MKLIFFQVSQNKRPTYSNPPKIVCRTKSLRHIIGLCKFFFLDKILFLLSWAVGYFTYIAVCLGETKNDLALEKQVSLPDMRISERLLNATCLVVDLDIWILQPQNVRTSVVKNRDFTGIHGLCQSLKPHVRSPTLTTRLYAFHIVLMNELRLNMWWEWQLIKTCRQRKCWNKRVAVAYSGRNRDPRKRARASFR